MRLAVFSDIHGNSTALDAVLADIDRQGGVDAYWVLGDLLALGPDPVGVMALLHRLENAAYVRGNADVYLVSGRVPFASVENIARDPFHASHLLCVLQNFAWTAGALAKTEWYGMLNELPLEQRFELPDGTRVLGVHAAPGKDDGEGIHPRMSEARLCEVLKPAKADLVFVGHTHWPMDVKVDSTRVVNLGSVSNPILPDLRAKYSVLTADENGYTIEHRRVEYDRAAVIQAVQETHNPGAEFLLFALRGENQPRWSAGATVQELQALGLPETWAEENA